MMPSLHAVAASLEELIRPVVTGLVVNNRTVVSQVGIGWPSTKILHDTVRQPAAAATIAIYDRKQARNTTRWNPFTVSETVTATTLVSIISGTVTPNAGLPPNGVAQITLGGSVAVNDAVSLIVTNMNPGETFTGVPIGSFAIGISPIGSSSIGRPLWGEGIGSFVIGEGAIGEVGVWSPVQAVVAQAGPSDTLNTLAAQLTSLINANTLLSVLVSAVAAGPSVTLTNKTLDTLTLQSLTGNQAVRTQEIGRRARDYQVVIWAPTEDIRQAVGDAIETALQTAELNFGITFADGTFGRLTNGSDYYLEDASVSDAYRRDFHLTMDYGLTVTDVLHSVLAPIPQFQLG